MSRHPCAASILHALEASNRSVSTAEDVGSAITRVGAETVAIVLTPPSGAPSLNRAIHMLGSAFESTTAPAIFVVLPERPSDREARFLYLEGAAGVFEWPRDSRVLSRMVSNLVERTEDGGHSRSGLARVVRARIGSVATKRSPRRLRVRVWGGLALLSGRVDSLWARFKIAEHARETPGIESVAAEDVRVEPSGRTDEEIAQSIRALLRGAAGIEHRTLTVRVHEGHVSVLGWADSPEEQVRLSELIGLTEGARDVDNRTRIDADAKRRDAERACAWEAEIGELFGLPDVHIAVVDGVAVLSGRVPRLSVKLGIQRRLDVGLVDRIVNQIEVAHIR